MQSSRGMPASLLRAGSPPARDARKLLHAYAQLLRLPNVFSALADIGLGWWASSAPGAGASAIAGLALLAASSACLYSAGMAWNDYFDLEQDRVERPSRPLPAGLIAPRSAALLGTLLIAGGVGFAGAAGYVAAAAPAMPLVLGILLAFCILLYDGVLKRTWLGPVLMGGCRFLNVLLGFSLLLDDGGIWSMALYTALVVGVYICGVTWFARTEARASDRGALLGAAVVVIGGILLGLAVPLFGDEGSSASLFPYYLTALLLFVGFALARAVEDPRPEPVQTAVKHSLRALIGLDAVLATALVGNPGIFLLLLLLPSYYLGRRIYST